MVLPARKVALVTGSATGAGRAIALRFAGNGYAVAVNYSRSEAEARQTFEDVQNLGVPAILCKATVADDKQVRAMVDRCWGELGGLDVLVNNAGFGAASPFEAIPMATVRELFETNVFGTMAVTQAVLPQFRQRRAGVVVNVTSSVTLKSLPLIASYTASKAAVNAFTESMALELQQFGVRARLVLPGRSPETRFGENAQSRRQGLDHEAYADLVKSLFARFAAPGPITHALDVAEAVWRAATDPLSPMRIPAGADAEAWAAEAR